MPQFYDKYDEYLYDQANLSESEQAQHEANVRRLTDTELLDFGIEIVAAMQASCYDWDIETGRILALQETEIDRMEEVTEIWDTLDDYSKKRYTEVAAQEKERLHKQAKFVAKIALEKFNNLTNA